MIHARFLIALLLLCLTPAGVQAQDPRVLLPIRQGAAWVVYAPRPATDALPWLLVDRTGQPHAVHGVEPALRAGLRIHAWWWLDPTLLSAPAEAWGSLLDESVGPGRQITPVPWDATTAPAFASFDEARAALVAGVGAGPSSPGPWGGRLREPAPADTLQDLVVLTGGAMPPPAWWSDVLHHRVLVVVDEGSPHADAWCQPTEQSGGGCLRRAGGQAPVAALQTLLEHHDALFALQPRCEGGLVEATFETPFGLLRPDPTRLGCQVRDLPLYRRWIVWAPVGLVFVVGLGVLALLLRRPAPSPLAGLEENLDVQARPGARPVTDGLPSWLDLPGSTHPVTHRCGALRSDDPLGWDTVEPGGRPVLLGRDPTPWAGVDARPCLRKVPGLSAEHLLVWWQGGQLFAADLGSSNGTLLRGDRMTPLVVYPLQPGDRIEMAGFLRWTVEDESTLPRA